MSPRVFLVFVFWLKPWSVGCGEVAGSPGCFLWPARVRESPGGRPTPVTRFACPLARNFPLDPASTRPGGIEVPPRAKIFSPAAPSAGRSREYGGKPGPDPRADPAERRTESKYRRVESSKIGRAHD